MYLNGSTGGAIVVVVCNWPQHVVEFETEKKKNQNK